MFSRYFSLLQADDMTLLIDNFPVLKIMKLVRTLRLHTSRPSWCGICMFFPGHFFYKFGVWGWSPY